MRSGLYPQDPPGDGGGKAVAAVAEGALVALAAEAGDEELAERLASTMGTYDAAISMAQTKMCDPLAANYLRMRRNEAWKALRRVDHATEAALQVFLAKDRETMSEMRERLRAEDEAKRKLALKAKQEKLAKQAEAERKKVEAKRAEQLAELALQIPRTWTLADFGQGCVLRLTPKCISNIRDVMTRLRLHSPDLPEDLAAQWAHILDIAPKVWHLKFGAAIGKRLTMCIDEVLSALKSGDKNAFVRFLREVLKLHRGDIKL